MSIPFIDLKSQQLRIRDKVEAGFAAVLDHGAYIMGPEVGALETRLAGWSGAKHNIACSSGTDALLLALSGLKLQPGDGVIVPSFTFAAGIFNYGYFAFNCLMMFNSTSIDTLIF